MNPELIRLFVLNEIMDDYEEVEHITEIVAKLGAKCGVLIQTQDVIGALISLTGDGFAKAYRMASKPGMRTEEIEGVPSLEEIQDPNPYSRCYFWATEKSKRSKGDWMTYGRLTRTGNFENDSKLSESSASSDSYSPSIDTAPAYTA